MLKFLVNYGIVRARKKCIKAFDTCCLTVILKKATVITTFLTAF